MNERVAAFREDDIYVLEHKINEFLYRTRGIFRDMHYKKHVEDGWAYSAIVIYTLLPDDENLKEKDVSRS